MSISVTKPDDSYSITPSGTFSFIGGGEGNTVYGTLVSSSIANSYNNMAIGYPVESYGYITNNQILTSNTTHSSTISVSNKDQEEKIDKLETRIKELESKLELLMDAIDTDKMTFKITI